jgi:hypothetical protein
MPSRTSPTVEDTLLLARPKAHEGSSAQTPVIVSIPHCALASSSGSPLSEVRALSYDPVFRFLDELCSSGLGFRPRPCSPSLEVNSAEGHGKLDHIRLAASRTRRSRGSRHGHPYAMGTADGRDPGRHRPMSATHDSVFKTGTLRPGTLHSVFPHLAVAHASRRSSQPRRSRPRHGGIVLPRSVSARTEHASSPAGSPAERDLRVHRRRPRPSRA